MKSSYVRRFTTAKFVEEIGGKSVITADHGEMLGERVFSFTSRVWGHSEGFSTKTLRRVPWLELSAESRRDIVESKPVKTDEVDEEVVNGRLTALGYAE